VGVCLTAGSRGGGGLEAAVRLEALKWGRALGVVAVGAQMEQEVDRVVEHHGCAASGSLAPVPVKSLVLLIRVSGGAP
jgi:hypothetical protein